MKGHSPISLLMSRYMDYLLHAACVTLTSLGIYNLTNRNLTSSDSVNCKFQRTSKLHMLHGVNNPYMVICNQSTKFHDCTLSRLLEPVYIEHIQHPYTGIVILDATKMTVFKGSVACTYIKIVLCPYSNQNII